MATAVDRPEDNPLDRPRRRTRNAVDAVDLLQETMLRACTGLTPSSTEPSFGRRCFAS